MIHEDEFLAEVLQDVESEELAIKEMELNPYHWSC